MDLKYGDWLIANKWYHRSKHPLHFYRFRVDPVPFCHGYSNWHFGCHYKRPKSTQERRLTFAYPEFVRKKRSFRMLPNAWDDYPRSDRFNKKSWKKKKIRKQWMKGLK